MKSEEIVAKRDSRPNHDQIKPIKHTEGPLLTIAGPGSGKTAGFPLTVLEPHALSCPARA